MKKLMLTAAAFALAVPVLTLAAAAQPDHRRDSTFQHRAQGQTQHQGRTAQQPRQATPRPAQPTAQPAPQQRTAQNRGRDHDQNRDRAGNRGGNRDNHARPGNDRRPDYRPGNNHRPGGADNHRSRRDWSSWRNDHRRTWHRPSHRFHGPTYHRPSGWYYRRWSFGDFLPSLFWSSQYWIGNYAMYGLPVPPPGATWVRYGNDAVLIDRFTGEVIDVEYDFFY